VKPEEQLPLDFGGKAPALPAKPLFAAALDGLRREAMACRRCGLRDGCRGVVFGEGDPSARLMLVGEGPGQMEDETGRPFVGAAGQLLERILEAIDLRRDQVYIANIVKCRPPGNRAPTPHERDACRPWLERQIADIGPDIIVSLGASAARVLLGGGPEPEIRITRLRGTWHTFGSTRVMPTFHPAALLRDPSKKRLVWEDFKKVRELLATGRGPTGSP
jgi:uracil-DNA glycosylase family 4